MPALTIALALAVWGLALKAPQRHGAVVPGLVLATVLFTSAVFWRWHVEDAGIVYAYADALAEGRGLSPGAGLVPVEGFSDPLWVAMLTPLAALGAPLLTASKLTQLLLSALTCVGVSALANRLGASRHTAGLAALAAATSGAWAVWSTGGLEVALFGCLLVGAALSAATERSALTAVLVAACALTRPEGAVAGVISAIAGAHAAGHGLRLRVPLTGAIVGLGGLLGARWVLLGTVLPTTAVAKLGGSPLKTVAVGLAYSTLAAVQLGAPWLWLAADRHWRAQPTRSTRRAAAGVLLASLGIAVLSGGDWMRHSRFLAPWVPVLTALLAPAAIEAAREHRSARVLLGLALGSTALVFAHAVGHPTLPLAHGIRRGALYAAITDSACPVPSVATPDIGGVLFTQPQLEVTDFVGLVDAEAARHKHEAGYWSTRLQQHPTSLVDLHGRWAERTGLSDTVLQSLDYTLLCRRGDMPTAPSLWMKRSCSKPPDRHAQALLTRWCEQGSGVRWPELSE